MLDVYHCYECKYDICKACYEEKTKTLQQQQQELNKGVVIKGGNEGIVLERILGQLAILYSVNAGSAATQYLGEFNSTFTKEFLKHFRQPGLLFPYDVNSWEFANRNHLAMDIVSSV